MFSVKSYRKLQSEPNKNLTNSKRNASKSTAPRLPPVPEQPKSKKLTMKVKELRSWLSDLGEKNQEHYHRFQQPTNSYDILGIQSKPSQASSCPSTEIMNDPLFAASFSSDEESSEASRSDFYQRKNPEKSSSEHVTTKDHLALLLKQAPRTQEGCSYAVGYDESRDDCESFPNLESNSTLFRDQILTKDTLDAMSGPKTLGEQLRELKEQQELKENSVCESSCQSSGDSLSIGPGVLVSKMASVFLNQRHPDPPPPPSPVHRKHVELPAFLLASAPCRNEREDLAYANPPKTPTTTVGKGIRKFGGPRKTLVERRKDQLHQKFGENRSAVFVQKKTWDQKNPHGKYARTTRVEKIYK